MTVNRDTKHGEERSKKVEPMHRPFSDVNYIQRIAYLCLFLMSVLYEGIAFAEARPSVQIEIKILDGPIFAKDFCQIVLRCLFM